MGLPSPFTAGLFGAAWLVACASEPTPHVPSQLAPTPSTSATEEVELGRGLFRSKRFGLDLPLPPKVRHRIDDRTSSWLRVESDDGSSLLVRMWRSENRMSRERCEREARESRALPRREGLELLEERPVLGTLGLDVVASVGLMPAADGALFGAILAFGGAGRSCFAYVYATRVAPAQEADPQAIVGERLAWMLERSLGELRIVRDFEVELERDRAVP
jgi:hypothetical protein